MALKTAAQTTVDVNDPQAPRKFQLEAFISGVKLPEFECSLYQKPDLAIRIRDLESQIDEGSKPPEEDGPERSLSEGVPVGALIDEHDALLEEFEASRQRFRFRSLRSSDATEVFRACLKDGHPGVPTVEHPEGKPVTSHEDFPGDLWLVYQIAQTSIDPALSGVEWLQIQDAVPLLAWQMFAAEWATHQNEGGSPSAPFSRRASRSPKTEA